MNTSTKTLFPQLVEASYANSYEFIQKYTSYLEVVSGFSEELKSFISFNNSNFQSDFVTSNAREFFKLNSKFENYDNEFIDFWVKKYNASVVDIKNIVSKDLGTKNNFFIDLSDSIGLLTNTECYLTESVIPVYDINVEFYPTPVVYTAGVKSKLRDHTIELSDELSKKNTSLYRYNIIRTVDSNPDIKDRNSTQSHGLNLISDYGSYTRIRKAAPDLASKLKTDFDKVFKLVTYYNTINDNMGYAPGDSSKNLQFITRVDLTQLGSAYNKSKGLSDLYKSKYDLLGKKIKRVRDSIESTNRVMLSVVGADLNAFAARTDALSLAKQPLATDKPAPLNATSKVNQVTASNNKVKDEVANTDPPTPVDQEEKKFDLSKIKQQEVVKIAKKEVDPIKVPITVTKIASALIALPATLLKFTTQSPFATLNQLKKIFCDGFKYQLDFTGLINFQTKLFTNFNKLLSLRMKKFVFKDFITIASAKLQQAIIKKILSLIPKIPIPDFKALLKKIKNIIKCDQSNLDS